MSMPRVLFTTVPAEVLRSQNTLKGKAFDTTSSYQSWTAMNPRLLQLRVTNPAFGLRFIRENVRGVEILEYPTWEEYRAALRRGWDVVGISFFTWTTPDALQMAAMAREAGAGQVWAGNYGVMTPDISQHFDRVYTGNCEAALKKAIEGVDLPAVEHPVIVGKSQWNLMHENVGFLYTKRGCGSHCTFCPTPRFAKGDEETVITGTDRVLDAYARLNASPVIIFDETFMENESHASAVIEQLARRNLRWVCLTRADRIVGRVAELKTRGLHSAIVGVLGNGRHPGPAGEDGPDQGDDPRAPGARLLPDRYLHARLPRRHHRERAGGSASAGIVGLLPDAVHDPHALPGDAALQAASAQDRGSRLAPLRLVSPGLGSPVTQPGAGARSALPSAQAHQQAVAVPAENLHGLPAPPDACGAQRRYTKRGSRFSRNALRPSGKFGLAALSIWARRSASS